jgi:hypothetical protein
LRLFVRFFYSTLHTYSNPTCLSGHHKLFVSDIIALTYCGVVDFLVLSSSVHFTVPHPVLLISLLHIAMCRVLSQSTVCKMAVLFRYLFINTLFLTAICLLLKCPPLVFLFRCSVCHIRTLGAPQFEYRCHRDMLVSLLS